MTILQEIQRWSKTLPAWQQHAVAKLYSSPTLSTSDVDHVCALLKAEYEIPDPEGREAATLEESAVAAEVVPGRRVQLVALKDLKSVNALAEGQRLAINPEGLTVIYGENGSGKSGYSRVLKKACRARDAREEVLANATKAVAERGTPSAVFELLVDGVAQDVLWRHGEDAPEEMSSLAVLDSHCARAHIDGGHGDFAYSPAGLEIVRGLATISAQVRERLELERRAIAVGKEAFAALASTQTEVGQLLRGLSGKTSLAEIDRLASLSEREHEQLTAIVRRLGEADPRGKADQLRRLASRCESLASRLSTARALVSDVAVETVQNAAATVVTTREAAELAASAFRDTPGQLPGTGGASWKVLFAAAEAFVRESQPETELARLTPDAACPLCQNQLGAEGAARVRQFHAFVQQHTERAAREARIELERVLATYKNARVDFGLDDALGKELDEASPGLLAACRSAEVQMRARLEALLVLGAAPMSPEPSIPALSDDLGGLVRSLVARLGEDAQGLDASANEAARAAMLKLRGELEARSALAQARTLVVGAVEKMALIDALNACEARTDTKAISRKATELAAKMATPEVVAALNAELEALDCHELRVVMKNESAVGQTKFKLTVPGAKTPSSTLSEGEQRAIAIASFLAEVTLGGSLGGIIFDDPVSSLDHGRRAKVAARLALEATRRQVIVFTHDMYFLLLIQQEAARLGRPITPLCLERTPDGFGVQGAEPPFTAIPTGRRLGVLKNLRIDAERAAKNHDDRLRKKLTRDAYILLRSAWEHAVEEVLLGEVVVRFRESVETNRLKSLDVCDEDWVTVFNAMKHCSKFAHAEPAMAGLSVPSPGDLQGDIDKLDAWKSAVTKRNTATAARRKSLVEGAP